MPATARTTTPANRSGILNESAEALISRPRPAREPNNSATTTPMSPRPMPKLEPGQDERYRGGQSYLEKDLPRGRAERAEHFDEPFAGGAQAGLSIDDDWKEHEQDDDQHLRPDADAKPQNEERRERDSRRRIK